MASNTAAVLRPDDPTAAQRLFRQVMGRFGTGVTVVTTTAAHGVHGMTANAFMAGSLEPMLCVVSINRTSRMHALLSAAGHYGVSFLGEDQQQLSAQFAGRHVGQLPPAFAYRGRTPVLERAVAAVTADLAETVECGDHTLFIGRITSLETGGGRPLLFFGGRYGRFVALELDRGGGPAEFW